MEIVYLGGNIMFEKTKKIFKRLVSNFTNDRCFYEMESKGVAAMGCCSGLVGGDANSEYLQYGCIGCKYWTKV
jgi:hypothetical protein